MDEVAKIIAGTSPVAAVILLLGIQALQIWKQDLQAANLKRDLILLKVSYLNKRLAQVETKLGLVPPPLPEGAPDDMKPEDIGPDFWPLR